MARKKNLKKVPAVKSLDNLLIVILIVLVLGIGAGVYFAYTNLLSSSKAASHAIAQLQKENAPMQNTEEIATQNQQYADVLAIVPRLSIPTSDIQSVITPDINKYARLTGILISSTTYGKESGTPGSNSSPTNNNTVSIEVSNTVPMKSVLQFIKLIENNIPLMYVTEISLEGTDGKDVKLNSMTIGAVVQ